ncbi:hypothetical protein GCM10027612_88180 [Microbispora bryophytorum subsp. camponoti]
MTGPDEYSAVADNNVYTNVMARRNLRAAAAAAVRHLDQAERLGVTLEETAMWRDCAAAISLPYDERLGVHEQNEGFTRHAVWDFAGTAPEQYPLLLHFPYFDLYRKQVVKQADLVLAMHLCGEAFTPEQKARNFAYYEALTVRDSSLSSCTQAVLAAEVGQLDLAYAYLGEAALMDLRDLEHNTRDGVHMASLAGAWIALVAGFGGMRAEGGRIGFAPACPRASPGSPSASATGAACCGSTSPRTARRTGSCTARPSRCRTTARSSRSARSRRPGATRRRPSRTCGSGSRPAARPRPGGPGTCPAASPARTSRRRSSDGPAGVRRERARGGQGEPEGFRASPAGRRWPARRASSGDGAARP